LRYLQRFFSYAPETMPDGLTDVRT